MYVNTNTTNAFFCKFLLQHPFIKDYRDKTAILDLICEAKADVIETVEDLTEEEDIKVLKVGNFFFLTHYCFDKNWDT